MIVLAIESSCDETGVAILQKTEEDIKVLASVLASQIDIHKVTGGVVPEVAAREHTLIIRPLIKKIFADSGVNPDDLAGIAVTVGPGLQPALAVGVNAARTLSYAWHKPLIPVHHLEGHIYSALLQSEPIFPTLALIVSGGHTMLVKISSHLNYKIIGTTQDDAAGEAFDKVARLLDLPYPGGPYLSKLAESGNPKAFEFPRPMKNSSDYNFSFSGLKTAVLYKMREAEQLNADIAASFQQAVIDSLINKTLKAAQQEKIQSVLLAGGVAANVQLRQQLKTRLLEKNINLHKAPLNLCGDNAIMIGQAAFFALAAGRQSDWKQLDAHARLSLA